MPDRPKLFDPKSKTVWVGSILSAAGVALELDMTEVQPIIDWIGTQEGMSGFLMVGIGLAAITLRRTFKEVQEELRKLREGLEK